MIRLLKNFFFGICLLSMIFVPNYVSAETANMTEMVFKDMQKILGDPNEDLDTKIQNATTDISNNPRNAKAYITRGFGYIIKADFEQALKDFDKVIELNPDLDSLSKAYVGRGYARIIIKRFVITTVHLN